ncbi:MAG: hypothetical protein KQ78_01551 [Candidatus Izimaplasma bacterium HR2]|nr:MAG: hypothetical protein KQ78_01551 [Candidatus Izimaplasma bacterium HR2]
MKVLLVEPNYKNKFPPIGLMKISQYHKERKDYVVFYKGTKDFKSNYFDRIYITSLFSFEYKITLLTANYYADLFPDSKIFIGGISATIMSNEYKLELNENIILIEGQLTNSNMLGFRDNINIDMLIPDYDILDEIDYVYKEKDSYFVHFSRGCVRSCDFCAVSTLEPKFSATKNVKEVVEKTTEIYGVKKYLRVMDNNLMYLKEYDSIIDNIKELGFGVNDEMVGREKKITLLYKAFFRRLDKKQNLMPSMKLIYLHILEINQKVTKRNIYGKRKMTTDDLDALIKLLNIHCIDSNFYISYQNTIISLISKLEGHSRIKKVVDFNQGVDARAIVKFPKRAMGLAEINLDPCRIAYDSIKDTDIFIKAVEICYDAGVKSFSNYLLFNYEDSPNDLYSRMRVNIDLSKKLGISKQFSFPMKYAPVKGKNRKFIGEHWSKLEIDGFYAILNVTGGVVTKEVDFFERAYGQDVDEFRKIILMPTEFIKNRVKYERNGFIKKWENSYEQLNQSEINILKTVYQSRDWDNVDEKIFNMERFYYRSKSLKL